MTLADYQVKVYYHNKRKSEASRERLEAMRYIAVYTMMPHLSKKTRVNKLSDIIPLPHELEQKVRKKLTKRQLQKRQEELSTILASHREYWEKQKQQKNAQDSRINNRS